MQKPSIPKGTRDFSPEEMAKRNYIFNTIRDVFHLYGYQQIETPAMENLSTLMGKYGEEGDKLLFKILNSGDFLSDFDENERELIQKINDNKKSFQNKIKKLPKDKLLNLFKLTEDDKSSPEFKMISEIVFNQLKLDGVLKIEKSTCLIRQGLTLKELKKEIQKITDNVINELFKDKIISPIVGVEKGLRYDLTVPFARYVVQHRSEITFPFKRYQIQPVWRADRPQKGRYREFYQCDADVVGSDSLLNEVELVQIMDEVYRRFNIEVTIKMNNRKILSGIAEIIGESEKIVDITVAIDKLDKIGLNKVNDELRVKGLSDTAIEALQPIIMLNGSNEKKIEKLKDVLSASKTGLMGVEELSFILDRLKSVEIKNNLELDLTLARGLNYYTGAIFEVKAMNVQIGSITGGGRYDNLTGVFGMKGISGVGISFGADRIFDVLDQLGSYPENSLKTTELLFVNVTDSADKILPVLNEIRKNGICVELYPEFGDSSKLWAKQKKYIEAKKIRFIAIVSEPKDNIKFKDMRTGEQSIVTLNELIDFFS